MASSKPYAGTSRSRLTLLLNLVNGTYRVENQDFTYDAPVAETDLPHGKNTSVVLRPVPGTLYRGPVKIYYDRLSLTVLEDLPGDLIRPAVIPQAPFWTREYLDEINAALGLDLHPDEVVNQFHPDFASSYTLRINGAASHAWLDSEYVFSAVRVVGEKLPLEFLAEVNGFAPGDPLPSTQATVPISLGGFNQSILYNLNLSLYPEVDSFAPNDYTSPPSAFIPTGLSGFTASPAPV